MNVCGTVTAFYHGEYSGNRNAIYPQHLRNKQNPATALHGAQTPCVKAEGLAELSSARLESCNLGMESETVLGSCMFSYCLRAENARS